MKGDHLPQNEDRDPRIRGEPAIILIVTPLLVIFQRIMSSSVGYPMFISSFLLFGAVPLALVVGLWHRNPREYGLQLGDWRWGLKAVAVLLPVVLFVLVYPASQTVEMRDFYPLDRQLENVGPSFLYHEVLRGVLFYTGWEFVFRGFALFGLRKYVGDWAAIAIQTILSFLWHVGFPTGEIVMSIPGGILFGYLALRTGSVFWPWLMHWFIAVGLDFFILVIS